MAMSSLRVAQVMSSAVYSRLIEYPSFVKYLDHQPTQELRILIIQVHPPKRRSLPAALNRPARTRPARLRGSVQLGLVADHWVERSLPQEVASVALQASIQCSCVVVSNHGVRQKSR